MDKKRKVKCWECEAEGDVEYHHPVPRSRGGTKTIPLCCRCHSKAHHTRERNVSHSNLVNEGLERAKQRGVKFGNPNLATNAHPKAVLANKARGQRTVEKYLPIVQRIQAELKATGKKATLHRLADRMNELGILSPRGGKIHISFVHKLFGSVVE